jgi:hypothetical protein
MLLQGIFQNWVPRYEQLWDRQPTCVEHRIHEATLFGSDALAQLIEHYPREHYSIVQMGERGGHRFWREGDLAGLSGRQVLEAIANGRLWLNLRCIDTVDDRFARLLDGIFRELNERMPGLKTLHHGAGLLISSPHAQVYYHADLPGQALFQIAGRKRMFVYPPSAPFITPEQLEGIAYYGLEVDIPYQPWYDEYAMIYDLQPGQMIYWPNNAPHRVENLDSINISLTINFMTEPIRRSQIVHLANGILRYQLGWTPRNHETSGVAFWSKAVLQKILRHNRWMRKAQAGRRPIEFMLDNNGSGFTVDLKQT